MYTEDYSYVNLKQRIDELFDSATDEDIEKVSSMVDEAYEKGLISDDDRDELKTYLDELGE